MPDIISPRQININRVSEMVKCTLRRVGQRWVRGINRCRRHGNTGCRYKTLNIALGYTFWWFSALFLTQRISFLFALKVLLDNKIT